MQKGETMKQTNFQEYMAKERQQVITKFQKRYRTREVKEKALSEMENKDIQFLIYCSCNLYANIFYSRFLSKREETEQK